MALFVFSRPEKPVGLSQRIRKFANVSLIAVFGISLGLMLTGIFRGDAASDIEQWELRRPEEFPKLRYKASSLIPRPDTRSIKHFPRQFEKWFNDHIGFRRPLIQLFQTARFHGLTPSQLSMTGPQNSVAAGLVSHSAPGQSSSEDAKGPQGHKSAAGQVQVAFGKDGWLYYQAPGCVSEARGLNLLTEDDLKLWKQTLEDRRDWFAKRGIRYVLMVAPNKATIYPEYLPDSMTRVSELSRLQQVTEYLARESDLTFIDLVEPLRNAKAKHRVYHKTDTHWNQFGAFTAYEELMKPLSSWYPQLNVHSIEDYEVRVHDCEVSNAGDSKKFGLGDLAVMSGFATTYQDQSVRFVPLRKEIEVLGHYKGFHRHEAIDEKHQLPRVVVLHDSFMGPMSQFITPHCREITYIQPPVNGFLPAEQIEQIQPVLVIHEIVQRHFAEFTPINPPVISEEMQADH